MSYKCSYWSSSLPKQLTMKIHVTYSNTAWLYDTGHDLHHWWSICQSSPGPKQYPGLWGNNQSPWPLSYQCNHHWLHRNLGIALPNQSNPIACNYLICSIETTLTLEISLIFLYFHWQFASFTSGLFTFLFPTLYLIYPEINKTRVWQTLSQDTCTSTISELLSSTYMYVQSVITFDPY